MGKWSSSNSGAIERLKQAIKDSQRYEAQTGWFANQQYGKGEGPKIPVATVAAIQEFGDPQRNLPPRPFMRPAADKNQKQWSQVMGQLVSKIPSGGETVQSALGKVAMLAVADVQQAIEDVTDPPLAPATIEARARKRAVSVEKVNGKPLIDTGQLHATVTSIVRDKNE